MYHNQSDLHYNKECPYKTNYLNGNKKIQIKKKQIIIFIFLNSDNSSDR